MNNVKLAIVAASVTGIVVGAVCASAYSKIQHLTEKNTQLSNRCYDLEEERRAKEEEREYEKIRIATLNEELEAMSEEINSLERKNFLLSNDYADARNNIEKIEGRSEMPIHKSNERFCINAKVAEK